MAGGDILTTEFGRFNDRGVNFDKGSTLLITHAAKINLPVEKTLEEKFEVFYYSQPFDVGSEEIRRGFAQIAKEHYEGKK
jgi:hypothetical protein